MSDFLPAGYVQPKTSGGFTKIEAGTNKFRILSAPLIIWLQWTEGKPSRHVFNPEIAKPVKGSGANDSVVHAWAMVVWNYKTEKIEVMELDKQGCLSTLREYAENPKWGHPKEYDIIITKTGSGRENTKYALTVDPKEPLSNEIIEAYTENPVDLNLLLKNENPFLSKDLAANPANVNTQPAVTNEKIVTPENWVAGDAVPVGYKVNPENGLLIKNKLPFD